MALLTDHGQGAIGEGMGHAGLGNRHGEGAEQGIGQGNRRATAQATVEGLERSVDAQATHQSPSQGADDQGDHHMHAGQTQDQHDADRGNYCIHSCDL
ncbi:hypothetical protein D3C79_669290 [compost metagenome]